MHLSKVLVRVGKVLAGLAVVAGLASVIREHPNFVQTPTPQVVQLYEPEDTDAPDREPNPGPRMRPVAASAISASESAISYGQTGAQKADRTEMQVSTPVGIIIIVMALISALVVALFKLRSPGAWAAWDRPSPQARRPAEAYFARSTS